jgi:hypothetical protein
MGTRSKAEKGRFKAEKDALRCSRAPPSFALGVLAAPDRSDRGVLGPD